MRRVAAVVGLVLLGLVLVAEIGLRVFSIPGMTRDELAPDLERLLRESPLQAHPYLTYVLKPGYSATGPQQRSINEWGFRGPSVSLAKPEDTYRIACLGGSSTYGHTPSSDATTWPARLQHWLNDEVAGSTKRVEVLNFGLSGWSTFESAANLALRVVDFEPDLVVVYHTINDARCALYLRGGPIRMDNAHWRAVWPRIVEAPGESLLERSRTYLVLRKLFTRYSDRVDALNTWAIVGYDPNDPDPYERGEPDERGFESFRRNLVTIQAVARAHGARVALVTQGCDTRDIQAGSRDNQIAALERMTAILREVAGEHDLILVDAKAEMHTQSSKHGIDTYFTREVHLTDAGADLLARTIAREVIQRELIR